MQINYCFCWVIRVCTFLLLSVLDIHNNSFFFIFQIVYFYRDFAYFSDRLSYSESFCTLINHINL